MSDFFLNLESLLSCHFAFFLFLYSSCQVNTFKPSDSCCQLEGGCAVVSPACAAGFLRLVVGCCVVSCVVAVFRMVLAPFLSMKMFSTAISSHHFYHFSSRCVCTSVEMRTYKRTHCRTHTPYMLPYTVRYRRYFGR